MTTQNIIKHTRFVAAISIAAILVCSMLAPINFASAAPGKPSTHPFTTHQNLPKGVKLLVDVHYKVTNDEDSGNVGYWALDNFNEHVKIWINPHDGTYWAISTYDGTFNTFNGALSPEVGAPETKDAKGQFSGGYTEHFTGTYAPTLPISGNLGTFDYGGTKADVLLQTYANQNPNPNTKFNVLAAYFPGGDFGGGSSDLNFDWGWTYTYKHQWWADLVTIVSGDIVT